MKRYENFIIGTKTHGYQYYCSVVKMWGGDIGLFPPLTFVIISAFESPLSVDFYLKLKLTLLTSC